MATRPVRCREYRSYVFDSRHWDAYAPREGDVVVSTSYKSGTTWMQNIVLHLIFLGREVPALSSVSPWLDNSHLDLPRWLATLESQRHRRLIKSHLPLDVIRYHPEARYIVVVRDPRDVFMSFWNTLALRRGDLRAEQRPEDPARATDATVPGGHSVFWDRWINRGWFDGESEGYPHSANLGHTRSWWDFRHLDNILFVHFNDLLADLPGEIGRVADYLGIPVAGSELARLAGELDFAGIKRNPERAAPMPPEAAGFIRRRGAPARSSSRGRTGAGGRARRRDLEMLERAKARVLTPDCAIWSGPPGGTVARAGRGIRASSRYASAKPQPGGKPMPLEIVTVPCLRDNYAYLCATGRPARSGWWMRRRPGRSRRHWAIAGGKHT